MEFLSGGSVKAGSEALCAFVLTKLLSLFTRIKPFSSPVFGRVYSAGVMALWMENPPLSALFGF
jgi:hypothetical protein